MGRTAYLCEREVAFFCNHALQRIRIRFLDSPHVVVARETSTPPQVTDVSSGGRNHFVRFCPRLADVGLLRRLPLQARAQTFTREPLDEQWQKFDHGRLLVGGEPFFGELLYVLRREVPSEFGGEPLCCLADAF